MELSPSVEGQRSEVACPEAGVCRRAGHSADADNKPACLPHSRELDRDPARRQRTLPILGQVELHSVMRDDCASRAAAGRRGHRHSPPPGRELELELQARASVATSNGRSGLPASTPAAWAIRSRLLQHVSAREAVSARADAEILELGAGLVSDPQGAADRDPHARPLGQRLQRRRHCARAKNCRISSSVQTLAPPAPVLSSVPRMVPIYGPESRPQRYRSCCSSAHR